MSRDHKAPQDPPRPPTIGEGARKLDRLSLRERAKVERRTLYRLGAVAAGYLLLIALTIWLIHDPLDSGRLWHLGAWFMPLVVVLALAFQTMDSATGMGFGTALAPLLLALGYEPLAVVPTLLIAQAAAGLVSAVAHHEFQNVRFSARVADNPAMRLTWLITAIGMLAIVVSVVLAYLVIAVPEEVIELYVAALVLVMGASALVKRGEADHERPYRPRRMLGFALLAGFNKGIGGGGYGPVVTLGQLYAGVYAKSAAAITSLAEALVSLAGIGAFLAISARGVQLDLVLLPSVLAGSVIAAMIAPYLVRILPGRLFSYMIPLYAVVIGLVVALKLAFELA